MDYLELASDRLAQYRAKHKLTDLEIGSIDALQQKLEQRVFEIAAFGLVSRGKTAVIKALSGNGEQLSTVDDRGQNLSVTTIQNPTSKIQIKLIDTPGLDKVDGEKSAAMAKSIANQADLILFVIAGDMNRLEQEALAQLRLSCKPVLLVLNKIDLYPEFDRAQILAAIRVEAARQAILDDRIILTAAQPNAVRVRIQSADNTNIQEVWEQPEPQIQDLKLKILDILNREGKALLAVNVLRALAQIQQSVSQNQLASLPPLQTSAAIMFTCKSIALIVSPSIWLDMAISSGIDVAILTVWGRGQNLTRLWLWCSSIVINSLLLAALGWESSLSQIAWAGISLPLMWRSLQTELGQSSGLGKYGATPIILSIAQSMPKGSILGRIYCSPKTDAGNDVGMEVGV